MARNKKDRQQQTPGSTPDAADDVLDGDGADETLVVQSFEPPLPLPEVTVPVVEELPLPVEVPAAIEAAVPAVVLTHEPSGETCTVGEHFDGHGACQRCKHCKTKIRPQHMNEACPAR